MSTAWSRKPRPPSSFDPEIPVALDVLVFSLLSLDPAMRPRSAFEVMQRLSAIAGLDRDEPLVSQAYLSTPMLVARDSVLATLAQRLQQAKTGRGSACMLRAPSGLGVRACSMLRARRQEGGADRVACSCDRLGRRSFAVAQTLADQFSKRSARPLSTPCASLGRCDLASVRAASAPALEREPRARD